MMEFTKNKNIITITVAPEKAYTVDRDSLWFTA